MKSYKKYMTVSVLALLCVVAAGCGCSRKTSDPASQQVLKISITPEPSPTPEPDQINSDAVVTNGNITMVNSYLEDNPDSSTENSTADGTDSAGQQDNATSDGESQDDSSEE